MTDYDAVARSLDLLDQKATMERALQQIATGRKDGGRPIGGQTAQGIARSALLSIGSDWTRAGGGPGKRGERA